MPDIHKTKAMATTAGAAFPFCFIDPTGASQLVFLTTATGAGVGLTIHASRSVWKRVQRLRPSSKPAKADGITGITADSADELLAFDQRAFEECIRKLASSITGVAVTGTLSLLLPRYVVGFLLNGTEVAYQFCKLRKMRDVCGGTEQLMENVSKLDVALQISAGVCIKFLTTTLFLGAADFNTFVDSVAHTSDALMASQNGAISGPVGNATEAADAAKAAHGNLIANGVLLDSTTVAGAPAEVLGQVLGHGTNYTPTWRDNAPASDWAAIGLVSTPAEAGLARVIEEPIHKGINVAPTAGEKLASSKHGHAKRKRKGADRLTPTKKHFSMLRRTPSPSAISPHASSPHSHIPSPIGVSHHR